MRSASPAAVPTTYVELLRSVQQALLVGQQEIDRAWVRTYHETGRLIRAHILFNKERADYGGQVFRRLATDTGASERKLYECAQFYRCFPILRHGAKFNWAHYRLFCQIDDETQRDALIAEAAKRDWTSPQLIERVRSLNAARHLDDEVNGGTSLRPNQKPLAPKRGTPGLHLVVPHDDGLAVDLGFKLYQPLDPDQTQRWPKASIARLTESRVTLAEDATKADLFTYSARVRRVVDGDTLVIVLDVSPSVVLVGKLRLRGIDCPEVATPEGKAAKRFTESLLPAGTPVVLSTTKPDKYDRYLADVFIDPSAGSGTAVREVFLNNALLENGHATRKDAWEFGDWE